VAGDHPGHGVVAAQGEAEALMGRRGAFPVAIALFWVLLSASAGPAQEFEPRTYAVAPVGLNFVALGYGFATGAVFMDPTIPAEDVDADIHLVLARYIRTLRLFNRPSKLKLVLPWSDGHWDGYLEDEFRTRDATGLGDARLVLETQFSGAEVKRPVEMVGYRPKTVWGARLQIVLPTGNYDNTKVINLGANRWGLIPEIGFSTPVGKWSLEGAVGAWIFGDNDDFYEGHHLEQDPLFVAKFHAVRSIRPGFWWALAAGYGYGARTTVDGVKRDTIQRNWRLAFVLAYPLRPNQGISMMIGSGGNFGAGTDFDTIALSYQYAWGGG
jgi:hypothetical protein